jgi:Domain of unknown function (DUF6933)
LHRDERELRWDRRPVTQRDLVSGTLANVVVIRCTERLLWRLKEFDDEPSEVSTTRLGDCYGNLLRVGQRHALLFISERSRLPVLLPVRAADRVQKALPAAVGDMLTAVGVPREPVEQELAQMSPMTSAGRAAAACSGP